MQPHALVEADLLGWRVRLPLVVIRVWMTVALVALLVASIAASTAFYDSGARVTAADVDGWLSLLATVAMGTLLVLPVLVAMAPTVAIWFVPILAAVESIDPALRAIRWWWVAAGVVALVLAMSDAVGALRQRSTARHWGGVAVPDLRPDVRLRLRAVPVLPALLVAGCLLAVAGGSVLWAKDRAAAEAFRSDAVVTSGVVSAVADDQTWADVRVGGRVERVPLPAVKRVVGDAVEVRHATDWSRSELVDDVFDPTGALVWVGLGLPVALVVLWSEGIRYASVRRVTRRGGIALRMRLQPVGGARRSFLDRVRDTYPVDLVPCDAPDGGGRVVARLRMTPIQAPDERAVDPAAMVLGDAAGGAAAVDDLDEELDGDECEDDELDEGEWDDDEEDLAWTDRNPTDEQLLAWLLHGPAPEPAPHVRREVVVIGLTRPGDRPLVLDEGWWLTAEGRAVDVARLTGELPPGRASIDWRSLWDRAAARWWRIWRHTGQAAPWLAIGLVYLLGRWVWSGETPHLLGLVHLFWALPLAGYGWLLLVRPRLGVRRSGVWVRGYFVDRWVPWREVVRVLADEHGVVLRMSDNAIPVPAPQPSGWLVPGVDDPRVAARALDEARRAGTYAPGMLGGAAGDDRERRRMSPVPLMAVLWLAAFLVPAIA